MMPNGGPPSDNDLYPHSMPALWQQVQELEEERDSLRQDVKNVVEMNKKLSQRIRGLEQALYRKVFPES